MVGQFIELIEEYRELLHTVDFQDTYELSTFYYLEDRYKELMEEYKGE